MEDLHIRLPKGLKTKLKKHCRDQNIAVTSAVIFMITRELRERSLATDGEEFDQDSTPSLGFILRQ